MKKSLLFSNSHTIAIAIQLHQVAEDVAEEAELHRVAGVFFTFEKCKSSHEHQRAHSV